MSCPEPGQRASRTEVLALFLLLFKEGLAQRLDVSPNMWEEKRNEGAPLVLPVLSLRTPGALEGDSEEKRFCF